VPRFVRMYAKIEPKENDNPEPGLPERSSQLIALLLLAGF
jgi:hypothetical protein